MKFQNIIATSFIIGVFSSTIKAGGTLLDDILPCEYTQIGNFSITGGNATYNAGTIQEIIWVRPGNESAVRLIKSNVSIADINLHTIYPNLNATGVPLHLFSNETAIDLTGSIFVEIPESIPDGTHYVFRLIIKSKSCVCYLDTPEFIIESNVPPMGDCTVLGSLHCTADHTGFQQCLQNGTVLDFGPEITCADTTVCSQVTENGIACVPPPPNECLLGETECVSDTESRTCIEGTSGGTVWSNETCPGGCLDGVCIPGVDECTLGDMECVSDTESRVCINGPNGTVWSVTECPDGCLDGVCINPVDECVLGAVECVSESETRTCIDGPNGTIWQITTCDIGTSCMDGICTSSVPTDECFPYHQTCLTSSSFATCLQNDVGLWQYSLTINCPTGFSCESYLIDFVHCV